MKNKLIHGDCLDVMKEIPDNSIDLILTDPPYEITNTNPGDKSGLCRAMQGYNKQMDAADIVSGFDYEKVLEEFIRIQKKINIYIWCNKAQIINYLDYFVTKRKCKYDIIKWVKTNPVPTFYNKYMTDTEYCLFFKKGAKCKPENYEDARTLYHAPKNVKDKKLYKHPTIKPVPILERIIRNSSKQGDVVFDPFAGSGSTAIAAINMKRDYICIEKDENFFNIAQERIDNAKQKSVTI